MSTQSTIWKLLRIKLGTADDVDWRTLQVSPHSVTALLAGTATDGTYSITITGVYTNERGDRIELVETFSALRDAAETSAQMAAELVTAAGVHAALLRHGVIVTASSATLTIQLPPTFTGTLTRSVTAPATITFPLGDTLIAMPAAPIPMADGECGSVVVSVHAATASAVLLPNDTFTFTIIPVELAHYPDPLLPGLNTRIRRVHVGDAIADCLLDTEYVIPLRGAKHWTIRLLTNTDAADVPATTDRFRVVWRDAGIT